MDTADRQRLDFVENENGIGQIVHTPCGSRPGAEQGFQKLHHGGEDHWRFPVGRQEFSLPCFPHGLDIRMVFQYDGSGLFVLFQNVADDFGVLFDDGGIGNDVNDTVQLVLHDVIYCETET